MEIRQATEADFPAISTIYRNARAYMKQNNNPHQWGDSYPPAELIRSDIDNGCCRVCTEDDEIIGVFCYFDGPDPDYQQIYGGTWQNDLPYGVMHRIAVAQHHHGVASACFAYGFSLCGNLKIDTHRDNLPMQRSLEKNGFVRCGIIHLKNGEERIAYQKARETIDS